MGRQKLDVDVMREAGTQKSIFLMGGEGLGRR
jgi:hypothetical protein